MQFSELRLSAPILRAVGAAGYATATSIQEQAIPPVLAGRDLLGTAQTGTGKTAAFSLPILDRLAAEPVGGHRPIRCLVLAPTRELAAQVGDSMKTYGAHLPLRTAIIFGGVGQAPQVGALRRGIDILVATPGRLIDLMNQGHVHLDRVSVFVLDEADRMLDMGFAPDIRRVVAKLPRKRQTLMFSATMPAEIRALAQALLVDPVEVAVTPQATTAETVAQRVYLVDRDDKQALLTHLLDDGSLAKALVFTRTKHGADRVAKKLVRADVSAAAIHGGKSQNARLRALRGFQSGETRVLVASDLASRGLDIDDVTHVINFDVPNDPSTYVHRIGRTGRAGATGEAISFCAAEELELLRDIEKEIRAEVPVADSHPFRGGFGKLQPVATRGAGGARGGRPGGRPGGNSGGGGAVARPGRRRRPSRAPQGPRDGASAASRGGRPSGGPRGKPVASSGAGGGSQAPARARAPRPARRRIREP